MSAPFSTISQITVGTTATTISSDTSPIVYGIRISNGGTGKLYYKASTSVSTTNGYLLNNAGDQISPQSCPTLASINLISDTASQAVSIEVVGQTTTIGS